jgi:hypothetical protein
MIGLCHSCHSSGVEIQLVEGINVCEKCIEDPKIIKKESQLVKKPNLKGIEDNTNYH